MKYVDKSMARNISLACAILGIAAALSGCGSRTDTAGASVGANSSGATAPAQSDPHVPPAAVAGQAALSQQRQAYAAGYAAMMKRQMAQQHKQ
jgi:hypothetical protein